MPSLNKSNYRSAFEACMYLTKGKPKVFNFLSQAECKNTFHYANTFKKTDHPTEKPIEFIKLLIQVSSNEGDRVVDPFMGSGTTAVACQELNREFLGFELQSDYIQMAKEYLKGGTAGPRRTARFSAEPVN